MAQYWQLTQQGIFEEVDTVSVLGREGTPEGGGVY